MATSTPAPTPAPTAIATPEPPAIDPIPIARGEPRPLPDSLALYYWVYSSRSSEQPFDVRRVIFDEASGTFREDRPLAFFDRGPDPPDYLLADFGISKSGQTLAVMTCAPASSCFCEGDCALSFAGEELRLWVSRNGGAGWEDLGQQLLGSWIDEVTDEDVRVGEQNLWQTRQRWNRMSDVEWEEMLARLAPLGLDTTEGWTQRFRWLASGEEYSPPPEPVAPKVGRLHWGRIRERPDGTFAWVASAAGHFPRPISDHRGALAITDREGSVERLYAAVNPLSGSFITDDILIGPQHSRDPDPHQILRMDIIDLMHLTSHEVVGLRLPFGLDPVTGERLREYYRFITARPALAVE